MGILSKCREIPLEVVRAMEARETEFFEEIGI
jgi:hypothetical protein